MKTVEHKFSKKYIKYEEQKPLELLDWRDELEMDHWRRKLFQLKLKVLKENLKLKRIQKKWQTQE